ncbi:MAG: serine/threonine-protein kinase [Planctomycetota bacterium]
MNTSDRQLDHESVLRAAAADLPENQPAALQQLAEAFPELSIEAAIGRGGSGTVYRVRQTRLDRPAALKILDPALVSRDPSFAERLEREGRAMAQLDHPGILKVFDFGERGGRFYLLTEFVDGIDLRKLMAMGALQPAEALRLVPPICEALQYAHDRGIVHRDIKPENVLLDVDGHVKLADFGLARLAPSANAGPRLTRDSQVMGTPHYMAPEQWRGAAVDHRADIFALGVVLYELLTGQVPSGAFTPPSARPGVPRRLDEIVRRALAQDPKLRYQRASELGHDVREQAAEPALTAPVAPRPVAAHTATKRQATTWMFVCATLSLLLAASVALTGFRVRMTLEATRAAEHALAAAQAARNQLPAPRLPRRDESAMPFETQLTFAGVVWVLSILMTWLGFSAIRRIVRNGPPFDGLAVALFFAWLLPLGVIDLAVAAPLFDNSSSNDVLRILVPLGLASLNAVFLVWRYRAATTLGKAVQA